MIAHSIAELGEAIGIDGAALARYAALDGHGGVDQGWLTGSLWAAEGRALYALTRALNVDRALELGTYVGCSATHMAQAMYDARRDEPGVLDAVDIWEGAGAEIPDDLRPFVHQHAQDMSAFIDEALVAGVRYELIFEDGPHDAETVGHVWRHAQRLLTPGGVIVSHDALHATPGPAVRAGITASGLTPVFVSLGESDCGLAVWRAV